MTTKSSSVTFKVATLQNNLQYCAVCVRKYTYCIQRVKKDESIEYVFDYRKKMFKLTWCPLFHVSRFSSFQSSNINAFLITTLYFIPSHEKRYFQVPRVIYSLISDHLAAVLLRHNAVGHACVTFFFLWPKVTSRSPSLRRWQGSTGTRWFSVGGTPMTGPSSPPLQIELSFSGHRAPDPFTRETLVNSSSSEKHKNTAFTYARLYVDTVCVCVCVYSYSYLCEF